MRIPTPGTQVTRALVGALQMRTGPWGYLVRARRRTDAFLACLESLGRAYPQGPSLLMVDHVSRPTAQAVGPWLRPPPRLHVSSGPTSGSPWHPVARLGRQLKNPVAANRRYGSRPV